MCKYELNANVVCAATVDSRLSTLMDNLQQTWTALCELLTTIDIQVCRSSETLKFAFTTVKTMYEG